MLYGAVEMRGSVSLQITNPQYEILDDEEGETIHTGRIVPVYEKTGAVTPKMQRRLVYDALQRLPADLPDHLPEEIRVRLGLPSRHAALLVGKSYLSALAALLLVSTTPLPQLLRGLDMLGVPGFLLMVAQFLYRYLFVIVEQGRRMRLAGLCRGGLKRRSGGFRAAAGALGVLFARSYDRAECIHRSMVSRGFQGHFQLLSSARFGFADAAFVCVAAGLPLAAALAVRFRG